MGRKQTLPYKTWLTLFITLLAAGGLVYLRATSSAIVKITPPASNPAAVRSIFYIGWGGGAIARKCPSKSCGTSYSFAEQEAIDLPYGTIDEMPEWVELSDMCKIDCFVHKSVFSSDPSTANVTNDWEDRVAMIECNSGSFGSGLLAWANGTSSIITARHVIEKATACRVHIPGNGYKELRKDSLHMHPTSDLAILTLGEYSEVVRSIAEAPVSVCKKVGKGDDVVVFGYPGAAKSTSVTLAEGIISNIYDSHYLTDANMGPGTSGGVVVRKSNGCYVGIPVQVSRGVKGTNDVAEYIENWGLILKATELKYTDKDGFSF